MAAARARRPPDGKPVRVLAYSTYGNTFGKGSLFDHILSELGAINVASERGIGPYGAISSEQVAFWNPDWIVSGGERASAEDLGSRLLADTGVAVTVAGRRGQVLIVEDRPVLPVNVTARRRVDGDSRLRTLSGGRMSRSIGPTVAVDASHFGAKTGKNPSLIYLPAVLALLAIAAVSGVSIGSRRSRGERSRG